MPEKEALILYKTYLCRQELRKLLADGLITEKQFKKIEEIVMKRLKNSV